jgi:hypothetical protein
MDSGLIRQRHALDRFFIPALWLHVPVIGVVAAALSGPAIMLTGTAGALAVVVTWLWATAQDARSTRLAISIVAIGMVSLLLAAARGGAWQIDVHMYYFAMLAMLAAYCDFGMVLVAAGTIAIHHLTLNFLAPALVFPGGTDTARVLLHAAVVVCETAALAWMCLDVAAKLEALYRTLAIIEFTPDGIITGANENFCAPWGTRRRSCAASRIVCFWMPASPKRRNTGTSGRRCGGVNTSPRNFGGAPKAAVRFGCRRPIARSVALARKPSV